MNKTSDNPAQKGWEIIASFPLVQLHTTAIAFESALCHSEGTSGIDDHGTTKLCAQDDTELISLAEAINA